MDIADIDPDFSDQIPDQLCTELMEQLPELLPRVLPYSTITAITIRPYPTAIRTQTRRSLPSHTVRIKCTCEHGDEQVVIGKEVNQGWIAIKVPKTSTRAYRKTSQP